MPRQLVENDTIVLNIQSTAVRSLELGNEWVVFNARFSGKPMDVSIPVGAVRAIFARENGLGCAFESAADINSTETGQAEGDFNDQNKPASRREEKTLPPKPASTKGNGKKSHLKLV